MRILPFLLAFRCPLLYSAIRVLRESRERTESQLLSDGGGRPWRQEVIKIRRTGINGGH